MRTGRPKLPMMLSKEEYEQLNSTANSYSLPYGLVNRACIVLMSAEVSSNCEIAEKSISAPRWFVNGDNVISSKDSPGSTMSYKEQICSSCHSR